MVAKTLKEVDIDGDLAEVKIEAIKQSPFRHEKSEWRDYPDVNSYCPMSEDELSLGNYISIYPTCTLEATIEFRQNRTRNQSVEIGLCEPCRQKYLDHIL